MSDRITKGLLVLIACGVLGLLVQRDYMVVPAKAQTNAVEYRVLTMLQPGATGSADRQINELAAKGWRARSIAIQGAEGPRGPSLVVLLEKP